MSAATEAAAADQAAQQEQPLVSEEDGVMTAAAAAATTITTQFVNHLDVKLHRVEGLPADWYNGEGEGPAYSQHPFRYEVTLLLPTSADNAAAKREDGDVAGANADVEQAETGKAAMGVVATFARGRLLAPLPQYEQFISASVPPPAVAAADDLGSLQDVPQTLELPSAFHATATATATVTATADDAAAAVTGNGGSPHHTTPPVLLWVATAKTDAASTAAAIAATLPSGSGAGPTGSADRKAKRKATAAANGSRASLPTTPSVATAGGTGAGAGEAALPLPEKAEAPPCVVRVPLDATQQTHLETLLHTQEPLTLVFRRVLRPGAPADWEDLNAGFFQATIPVSLAPFAEPGSLRLDAAVPLCPRRAEELQAEAAATTSDHERLKKKAAARRNKAGMPPQLYEDPDPAAPHPYVAAGTTAVISLSLQRAITQLAMDRVRPAVTPQQLIPSRTTTTTTDVPAQQKAAAASVSEEVAATLEGIAQKVLRDYRESKGGSGAMPTAAATQAEKEAWRARFLEFFQASGQLAAYKAQLTPLVARLARERFAAESPGATRTDVAKMSNELYVYLLESMHAALRRLVVDDSSESAAAVKATAPGQEAACECGVWRCRAVEAEVGGDNGLAATYHQARIQCACDCANTREASPSSPSPAASCALPVVWTEAANFYARVGDSVKSEQCYREAVACDAAHLPALLGYGMLLLSYGRLSEAAVFLHGAVDVAPQHALVWGCIALLDDLYLLNLKEGSPLFALDKAKWEREHRYAVQQAVKALPQAKAPETTIATPPPPTPPPSAAPSPEAEKPPVDDGSNDEAVYLLCARYAAQLHHHDLANVCLAHCQAGSLAVECLYARIFTQGGQHRDALNTLDEIEASLDGADKDVGGVLQDSLAILRATCEEALGHTEQAARSYKRGLCRVVGANGCAELAPYLARDSTGDKDDDSSTATTATTTAVELSFDPHVTRASASLAEETPAQTRAFFAGGFLRLGSLLLASAKYKDALGVLALGLQAWPGSSTLWLGAGIAYHRLGNPVAAEECLNESNCVNPLNPKTWAYLALLAMGQGGGAATTPTEVEQCLRQAMVHGLADAALWAELGRELLLCARQPRLSEVCLRRALDSQQQQQGRGGNAQMLTSTCTYHLAHALAHQHRWEEAKAMLERVVRTSQNEVLKAKAEEELQELVDSI